MSDITLHHRGGQPHILLARVSGCECAFIMPNGDVETIRSNADLWQEKFHGPAWITEDQEQTLAITKTEWPTFINADDQWSTATDVRKAKPAAPLVEARHVDVHVRRQAGESFASIARDYGVSAERVRAIFLKVERDIRKAKALLEAVQA